MQPLEHSVGREGVNDPADVLAVQRALNRFGAAPRLSEDGLAGEKTLAAILAFQANVVGMSRPDGRIDPGGRTWQKLANAVPPSPSADTPPTHRPENVEAFLTLTLAAAQQVQSAWGVPASVCLAQAALESGWGQSVKDNAYFGIKGKSLAGGTTEFITSEFVGGKKVTITDSFRAYRDFAEAADDYGRFLAGNPRYEPCFRHRDDPLAFADSLQAAGYATDPAYAEKIKRVITTYRLQEYDA